MRVLLVAALLAFAVPVSADHASGIQWACGGGGSGRDGHPDRCGIDPIGGDGVGSATDPVWGDAWVADSASVLGVEVNGDAVAVPVVLLDRHEIANVEVGGVPVAITYCPLCGSGVTFERTTFIGGTTQTLDFTASGFLYQHDLVMWDSQTGTLWTQILGEPIGSLRDRHVELDHPELRLNVIPTALTTWGEWHAEHPDSPMLQGVPGARYGSAYAGYEGSCRYGISGHSDCDVQGLHPKELVIGVSGPRGDLAVPRFAVTDVHIAEPGVVLVKDGPDVRAYDVGRHTFTPDGDGWVDETGRAWDLHEGRAVDGVGALEPLTPLIMYWFAWEQHHPDSALWVPADADGALSLHDNGQLPGFTIGIVAVLLVAIAFLLRRRQ